MDSRHLLSALIASVALVAGAMDAAALAQQPEDANVPSQPSNNPDDNQVTVQIRAALAADESLSSSAKTIEIVTNQEAVILRGAVASGDVKDRIESIAGEYAGSRQVQDELTIRDNAAPAVHHLAVQPPH